MKRLVSWITTFCALAALAATGVAASSHQAASRLDASDRLSELVRRDLSKKYPGANIELTGPFRWLRGSLMSTIEEVRIVEENSKGEVRFTVRGTSLSGDAENRQELAEGVTTFAAWVQAPIALRRIQPGEHLNKDMFTQQDVNVAAGMAREYRGVIVSSETDLGSLEAKQTIIEGQYPLLTGVQRVPDVRKGDAIRVQIVSGGLVLSTSGVAAESAYVDGRLRVMTGQGSAGQGALRTKRELTGQLRSGGFVEVRL